VKLSEKLLQRHRVHIDAKPLIVAFRQLRRVPWRHVPTLLEMLARRPSLAVMEQQQTADGVVLIAKPARELAMFLKRAQ
jgi:hypothetical protein